MTFLNILKYVYKLKLELNIYKLFNFLFIFQIRVCILYFVVFIWDVLKSFNLIITLMCKVLLLSNYL